MILRKTMLAVMALCLFQATGASADETGDKLDAILKELRTLGERVSRLEARVQRLARQQAGNPPEQPAGAPRNQLPVVPLELPRLPKTADGVIRLPKTASGALMNEALMNEALMNEVHERERILRKRFFPPEIMPQPRFPIPRP